MPFDGTNLTPLQQALMEARKLIEAGWCKNDLSVLKYGKVQFCITGAIRQVVYGNPYGAPYLENPKAWSLEDRMRTALFPPFALTRTPAESIEQWNDMKSRRKKEVLGRFDRAIVGIDHDIALQARSARGWR